MEKLPHLAGFGANEQSLFHGTPDEATVRCIFYQNFDPRMHGRHGTVYGKGVYFSATAEYSHHYTQPCLKNGGRRFMFYARVLVGKSTIGKSDLQRPPPVDPSRPHGALFDSCINSSSSPTIVVIFDNDQCYPEFLIEYELCGGEETALLGMVSGNGARRSIRRTVSRQSSPPAVMSSSSYSPSPSAGRAGPSAVTAGPSVVAAQTYPSRPYSLRTSSAAATQARPTPATDIDTSLHSTPTNTAQYALRSSPVRSTSTTTRAAQKSQKGCVTM